jgi:redox-sensing transcriptional repressor
MPNKKEIERLLRYRMCLNRLKGLGFENVFSYFLAEEIGVSPEQIRKDLSNFNIRGRKKSGYDIDQLLTDIEGLIGKDTIKKIVIVGMGKSEPPWPKIVTLKSITWKLLQVLI